ncbi:MAG TPA: ABC transporter ATP-binding protein [Gaiellaceae bacterium]|nr:ABC transporter ATP-binding protein [Gaiellaceae bacterium]
MSATARLHGTGRREIERPSGGGAPSALPIEVVHVSRSFDRELVLNDISLDVEPGHVRALLGPNGAGKTTLLRILSGLAAPDSGSVRVGGLDPLVHDRVVRRRLGLVPSGDRTFYERLSGLENLVFFARLHGMRRRDALARAREVLEQVELRDAARRAVRTYSHGMQKRLSVARALLTRPSVFLVDEATHDLDPAAARNVMDTIRAFCDEGAAVVWATQRIDEIRGFADRVTLLSRGNVRFSGTVPDLMSHAAPRRFLLRLRNGRPAGALDDRIERALGGRGSIASAAGASSGHYTMNLRDGVVLGDALAALAGAGIQVLACREERSEIEEAFLSLMREDAP